MIWKDAPHRAGCALYFCLFMAFGSISPFLPVIWLSTGLSDQDVGWLVAIKPLADIFAGPFICALADKHDIQQKVLYASLILFAVTRSSVLFAGHFWSMAAVEASSAISQSPIVSLIDSAVRSSFGAGGYGSQRMWGAGGHGFASLISGVVYDTSGNGYESVVVVFVVFLAAALVAASGVRVGAAPTGNNGKSGDGEQVSYGFVGETSEEAATKDVDDGFKDEAQGRTRERLSHGVLSSEAAAKGVDDGLKYEAQRQVNEHESHGVLSIEAPAKDIDDGFKDDVQRQTYEQEESHGVLAALCIMFSTTRNASFFASVVLSNMGKGVIDTFLFIWLEELGGSHLLLGMAGLIMCGAEVPFFYLSGAMLKMMGPRTVVALSQIGYLLRFASYSVLQDPWWVLPVEVIHGLTFAAMWAATTDFAHEVAPAHIHSTVFATVSALERGLGYGIGAVMGGIMYSSLGARLCFGVCASLPSVSLLLLAIGSRGEILGGRSRREMEQAVEEGLGE